MGKRLIWLLFSLATPTWLLLHLGALPTVAQRPLALHDVIINEWSQGTAGSQEWVELLVVNGPVDMRGWDLGDDSPGDLTFADHELWRTVPPGTLIVIYNGSARDTVLPPDQIDPDTCVIVVPHNTAAYFSGNWPAFANTNTGDNPHLRDAGSLTVHNFSVEPGATRHPGAGANAQYNGSTAAGVSQPANWTNGTAAGATPGAGNSSANAAWRAGLCHRAVGPDLALSKSGPAAAVVSETIAYEIHVSNYGNLPATGVVLTDTLPAGLAYVADSSGYALNQPAPGVLVWTVADLPASATVHFYLSATIGLEVSGWVTNMLTASTAAGEADLANNYASAATLVNSRSVLIDAVLYDGYELNDADEAVALRNVSHRDADIGGWRLSNGSTMTTIPAATTLPAGQTLWLARNGSAFGRQFGFAPHFEAVDSQADLPNLIGSWPALANTGGKVILFDSSGAVVDALVYKNADTAQIGWFGPAVWPYRAGTLFAEEGQLLYRRRDQHSGLPVPDTNMAADWAQSLDDVINGRKVRYPGWDLDTFFFPVRVTDTAVLTVAIAPDNAYHAIVAQIESARHTIQIETLTFENVAIGQALAAAANRGVDVTVLLEGSPPGGLPLQEKFVCQQLEAVGGQCWFMIRDDSQRIFNRYRFLHAKFIIIDGVRVIVSSENLSPNSLPADDKRDGTWGRRGVVLITDAPAVVAHVQTLFAHDFNLKAAPDAFAGFLDLVRWSVTAPIYGPPPSGFVPVTETGGITYTVRYPMPATFTGSFGFEIVQSPENSLRDQDSLLGLVNQAGLGDTILVQQLSERPYWGPSSSNANSDPNPRLEAYINAARRGAIVRILLDEFFDDSRDPLSNFATCGYIKAVASAEHLRLDCARANPSGLGIHNKMVLVQINGRGIIHVGSLNGTEQSNKGNRELALQVQSDGAYALLAEMFDRDWPYRNLLPLVYNGYIGPASYVLISEVLYDPPGPDDAEFIELVNPTGLSINLSHYSLGDAVERTDFEDVRRFPEGVILAPGATLVVATSATAFKARYGFNPDFEILDTDSTVSDLIDDPSWGNPATFLRLGNSGDELILRDPGDRVVDVIVYGEGYFPGVAACPLVMAEGHSLERFPYWRHTGNCNIDFRDWPFPNPGRLP